MAEPLTLAGFTDADLADLIDRASLLREWIRRTGSETVFDGNGLFTPVSLTAVLGTLEADRLRRGLDLAAHLQGRLVLGLGLSAEFGPDRLAEGCPFEKVREVDRVILEEAVACLVADRRDEVLVRAPDVTSGSGGVGVDVGLEQHRDVGAPDVHHPGELLAAEGDLVGTAGPLGHGDDLLVRLRKKLGHSVAITQAGAA